MLALRRMFSSAYLRKLAANTNIEDGMKYSQFVQFLYHFDKIRIQEEQKQSIIESNQNKRNAIPILSLNPMRDAMKITQPYSACIQNMANVNIISKHVGRPYSDFAVPEMFKVPRFLSLMNDIYFQMTNSNAFFPPYELADIVHSMTALEYKNAEFINKVLNKLKFHLFNDEMPKLEKVQSPYKTYKYENKEIYDFQKMAFYFNQLNEHAAMVPANVDELEEDLNSVIRALKNESRAMEKLSWAVDIVQNELSTMRKTISTKNYLKECPEIIILLHELETECSKRLLLANPLKTTRDIETPLSVFCRLHFSELLKTDFNKIIPKAINGPTKILGDTGEYNFKNCLPIVSELLENMTAYIPHLNNDLQENFKSNLTHYPAMYSKYYKELIKFNAKYIARVDASILNLAEQAYYTNITNSCKLPLPQFKYNVENLSNENIFDSAYLLALNNASDSNFEPTLKKLTEQYINDIPSIKQAIKLGWLLKYYGMNKELLQVIELFNSYSIEMYKALTYDEKAMLSHLNIKEDISHMLQNDNQCFHPLKAQLMEAISNVLPIKYDPRQPYSAVFQFNNIKMALIFDDEGSRYDNVLLADSKRNSIVCFKADLYDNQKTIEEIKTRGRFQDSIKLSGLMSKFYEYCGDIPENAWLECYQLYEQFTQSISVSRMYYYGTLLKEHISFLKLTITNKNIDEIFHITSRILLKLPKYIPIPKISPISNSNNVNIFNYPILFTGKYYCYDDWETLLKSRVDQFNMNVTESTEDQLLSNRLAYPCGVFPHPNIAIKPSEATSQSKVSLNPMHKEAIRSLDGLIKIDEPTKYIISLLNLKNSLIKNYSPKDIIKKIMNLDIINELCAIKSQNNGAQTLPRKEQSLYQYRSGIESHGFNKHIYSLNKIYKEQNLPIQLLEKYEAIGRPYAEVFL